MREKEGERENFLEIHVNKASDTDSAWCQTNIIGSSGGQFLKSNLLE